ncbi:MAG TPA: flagellar hook-basal body complex protein FliE [Burkholderiales bacterium]|nr:flagellar hook-basal body complex protein FliE [Burkholderiales bacterium]
MNVAPIDPSLLAPEAASASSVSGNANVDFSAWLGEQVSVTNQDIVSADGAVRQLAVGDPVNLHQVMVQLERARLQLELVVQVRNKLLDAYQDILKMQI